MTEDEANLKRCCGPSDCGHESDNGPGGPGRYCIGSACMAWREGVTSKFKNARSGQLLDRDLTGHGTWVKVDGYCGLAGAPA